VFVVGQYAEAILIGLTASSAANFARARVRPTNWVDVSASVVVFKPDTQRIRVQMAVINLTNWLNVINFAGLFSGTALGPTRSVSQQV
jgi:hypothetical protein